MDEQRHHPTKVPTSASVVHDGESVAETAAGKAAATSTAPIATAATRERMAEPAMAKERGRGTERREGAGSGGKGREEIWRGARRVLVERVMKKGSGPGGSSCPARPPLWAPRGGLPATGGTTRAEAAGSPTPAHAGRVGHGGPAAHSHSPWAGEGAYEKHPAARQPYPGATKHPRLPACRCLRGSPPAPPTLTPPPHHTPFPPRTLNPSPCAAPPPPSIAASSPIPLPTHSRAVRLRISTPPPPLKLSVPPAVASTYLPRILTPPSPFPARNPQPCSHPHLHPLPPSGIRWRRSDGRQHRVTGAAQCHGRRRYRMTGAPKSPGGRGERLARRQHARGTRSPLRLAVGVAQCTNRPVAKRTL